MERQELRIALPDICCHGRWPVGLQTQFGQVQRTRNIAGIACMIGKLNGSCTNSGCHEIADKSLILRQRRRCCHSHDTVEGMLHSLPRVLDVSGVIFLRLVSLLLQPRCLCLRGRSALHAKRSELHCQQSIYSSVEEIAGRAPHQLDSKTTGFRQLLLLLRAPYETCPLRLQVRFASSARQSSYSQYRPQIS